MGGGAPASTMDAAQKEVDQLFKSKIIEMANLVPAMMLDAFNKELDLTSKQQNDLQLFTSGGYQDDAVDAPHPLDSAGPPAHTPGDGGDSITLSGSDDDYLGKMREGGAAAAAAPQPPGPFLTGSSAVRVFKSLILLGMAGALGTATYYLAPLLENILIGPLGIIAPI